MSLLKMQNASPLSAAMFLFYASASKSCAFDAKLSRIVIDLIDGITHVARDPMGMSLLKMQNASPLSAAMFLFYASASKSCAFDALAQNKNASLSAGTFCALSDPAGTYY